jgi:hypothetical protein
VSVYDKDLILGEIMKKNILKVLSASVATLGLVAMGFGLAQQTQNDAEKAILAMCGAAGGEAARATTVAACLKIMVDGGVISNRTAETMKFAVETNSLTNNQFAIFVADVVNGAAPAPSNGNQAARQLADKGITVPTGTDKVDGETVSEVVTTPAVTTEVQTGYTQGLSGIRR